MTRRKLPLGVVPNGNNYMAQAQHNRQRYYLGTFKTPEEAGEVYRQFREANPVKESTVYKRWNPGDGAVDE